MIITTTNNVAGQQITAYLGLVHGETIVGVNALRDIGATFRDLIGGRSGGYEKELVKARAEATQELERRAAELGAHAVVGVSFDTSAIGQAGSMLMINVTGTAVTLAPAAG